MTRDRLLALLKQFSRLRFVVLGDLFLDQWAEIDPALAEVSLETGLPAHQVRRVRSSAGAAGTVLGNLRALGVGCEAVGFVGVDGQGWMLRRLLEAAGVETEHVLLRKDRITPAYWKPMFDAPDGGAVEGNRFDFKNRTPTAPALEAVLLERLQQAASGADAVLALDQLEAPEAGTVTARMRGALADLQQAEPKRLVYADSRSSIHDFAGITLKCNWQEALGRRDAAFDLYKVRSAFEEMEKRAKAVFVTCSERGILLRDQGWLTLMPPVAQPGSIDPCGAGDACSAGLTAALCAGASPLEAALIGNLVAGVTLRKLGATGTASPAELVALWEEQGGEAFGRDRVSL